MSPYTVPVACRMRGQKVEIGGFELVDFVSDSLVMVRQAAREELVHAILFFTVSRYPESG